MENAEIKKLAIEANNQVWNYLQKKELNLGEDLEMLASAYASFYLWKKCGGTALHLARGHWLISRICCHLRESNLALQHAKLCEKYTDESPDKKDFDEAYKWEVLARSSALLKNFKEAKELKNRA
ncbi:MAG: hypothetical protein HY390_03645 [Deltaproteobacteria bacterium]|nr:hypothetical protein [Deltaproteobacteria bacterium]